MRLPWRKKKPKLPFPHASWADGPQVWRLLAMFMLAQAGWDLFTGDYMLAISGAAFAALCLVLPASRQRYYIAGRVQGRIEMVLTLKEAFDRGMTLQDWLDAEQERTAILMTTGQ